MDWAQRLRRIRWALAIFIFGMIVSGITAFPLTWEMEMLCRWLGIPEAAQPGSLDAGRA